MAVITISRQFGSHGDTVAQLLCDRLGYRYLDKNLLMGLAVQVGMDPEHVVDLSDATHRARSLMERLFGNYAAPMADPDTWAASAEASAREQRAAAQIKQLIRAAHEEGNVVVIGRGGQVVLRDLPNVLHLRLISPLELRIRRHQERAGLTPDAAREVVLKRDRASVDFVLHHFGADPTDPDLYDLIINTATFTPFAAVDLIVAALASLPSREPPTGS